MCREYKPLHSINKFAEQTKMTKKSIPSNHSPYFLNLPKQDGVNHLIFQPEFSQADLFKAGLR